MLPNKKNIYCLYIMRFTYSALILLLCSTTPSIAQTTTVNFKIIHTTDVHGALFPIDFINNTAASNGLAQVYSYVKQERARANQHVILLDGGDMLQGQPSVYFANHIDTTGEHIIPRVMNFMGYNAMVPGNHDIEVGPSMLAGIHQQANFPWLAANVLDTRTAAPYYKPYHIVHHNGARIAILGLTTPAIPEWLPSQLWPNKEFQDMIQSARAWMDTIMIREKPHAVIGLFHAGYNGNNGSSTPNYYPIENPSGIIARTVPGFDVILMGHSHEVSKMEVVNAAGDTVLLLNPGPMARMVSDVTLSIAMRHGSVTSKRVEGKLVDMSNIMPDLEFTSNFSSSSLAISEFVDRRIGFFEKAVSSYDAFFGPSAFVNLVHSVQLSVSNAQISFAAPLSFQASISQGHVHVRDLFKLYPYENMLYVLNLTGREVKQYLEHSIDLWYNTMSGPDDYLIRFLRGENGEILYANNGRALTENSFFNFDSAFGIRYQVDVSKIRGERVTILSLENGDPFLEDETYRVVLNSYRGSGGGGHLTVGISLTQDQIDGRILGVSPRDIRYYLMRWIESSETVKPVTPDNWKVIPSEWVDAAKPRDAGMLFGAD